MDPPVRGLGPGLCPWTLEIYIFCWVKGVPRSLWSMNASGQVTVTKLWFRVQFEDAFPLHLSLILLVGKTTIEETPHLVSADQFIRMRYYLRLLMVQTCHWRSIWFRNWLETEWNHVIQCGEKLKPCCMISSLNEFINATEDMTRKALSGNCKVAGLHFINQIESINRKSTYRISRKPQNQMKYKLN